MSSLRIVVATHKAYWMPAAECYLPLQVGAAIHDDLGLQRDDHGDNISARNQLYSELTGLFWAWKNLHDDHIGLVHFRRHFTAGYHCSLEATKRAVLAAEQYNELLQRAPIIVPRQRNYVVETNRSQYEHAHNPADLALVQSIVQERHPDCSAAFERVMERTRGHRFNIFVMRRDLLNDYCQWLFDILFEAEKRIDTSTYNDYNKRVLGFLGERLLDVWLEARQANYVEQHIAMLEDEHWPAKIWHFLKRKANGGEDFRVESKE